MTDTTLADQRLIDAEELSAIIGRPAHTVRIDAHKRPDSLPPRFLCPGTRLNRWRVADVRGWIEALADQQGLERQKASREAALEKARKATKLPFHPGETHATGSK